MKLSFDEIVELIHREMYVRNGVMLGEKAAAKAILQAEEAAQHRVHPTNGGLALRACVSAHCGWVGKESACLTWKHAGDERMCPHCHDNTESIPLSAISG